MASVVSRVMTRRNHTARSTMVPTPPPFTGAGRAFALAYLAFEVVSVGLFWAALSALPGLRAAFVPRGIPDTAVFTLLLPDAVFLPATGVLAAWAIARPTRWTLAVLWLHAGAALYAGLFAVGIMLVDRSRWVGAGLMLPMLAVPAALALRAMHTATPDAGAPGAAARRTLLQIVVCWTFFLFVMPNCIHAVEQETGLDLFGPPAAPLRALAILLFALGATIGLCSAWIMSMDGVGTPLPIDPAARLVVRGPYALVRNPMAIGGTAKCLAVGLWLGSAGTVLCVLVGAIVWQVLIRPIEERELLERFGESYAHYRSAVRCWLPRLRRYDPGEA